MEYMKQLSDAELTQAVGGSYTEMQRVVWAERKPHIEALIYELEAAGHLHDAELVRDIFQLSGDLITESKMGDTAPNVWAVLKLNQMQEAASNIHDLTYREMIRADIARWAALLMK